jgi:hypothetical protein
MDSYTGAPFFSAMGAMRFVSPFLLPSGVKLNQPIVYRAQTSHT